MGKVDRAANYRGISLLDVGYKLLTKIMARRLTRWTEERDKLGESQAGFRLERSTRDHTFTHNTLIGNRLKTPGKKLYVVFIDFRAAST